MAKPNTHLIAAAPDNCHANEKSIIQMEKDDKVICDLCKQINPQHSDCDWCSNREQRLLTIKENKEALAKSEGKE